jgi:hypothetical protein
MRRRHNLLLPSMTIARQLLAENADRSNTMHGVIGPGAVHAIVQLIEHAQEIPKHDRRPPIAKLTRDPDTVKVRGRLEAWPAMNALLIVDCGPPFQVGDSVNVTIKRLPAKRGPGAARGSRRARRQ